MRHEGPLDSLPNEVTIVDNSRAIGEREATRKARAGHAGKMTTRYDTRMNQGSVTLARLSHVALTARGISFIPDKPSLRVRKCVPFFPT